MHDVTPLDCSRIAQDLQIRKLQVESVIELLDEGNTVPFIARYRKERAGGLSEEALRHIQMRVHLLRQLADRKQTILKSITGQGKLTESLSTAVLAADTHKRLDDLYLPYKAKNKRTPAAAAREKGLENLAQAIWQRDVAIANLAEVLPTFLNPEKGLATAEDVQTGVRNILAEMVAETADVRAAVRALLWDTSKIISSKNEKQHDSHGQEYKDYFQFNEAARQIPPHRILALNRGERETALKVRLDFPLEAVQQTATTAFAEYMLNKPAAESVQPAAESVQPSAVSPPPAEVVSPPPPPSENPAPPITDDASSPASPGETVASAGETPAAPVSNPEPALTVPPPPAPVFHPLPPDVGEPITPNSNYRTPHAAFLKTVIEDALTRLLLPAIEREIRHELTEEAESHAVAVFARNLRSLLLQPPLRNKRVLAIDPGFRGGCKIVVLDEQGNSLEDAVIHPHTKKKERPPKAVEPAAGATPATPASGETPTPATEGQTVPPVETGMAPPPTAPSEETPAPTSAPAAPSGEDSTGTVPPTSEAAPVEGAAPATAESAAPPVPEKPPVDKKEEARTKLKELVAKHQVQVFALGNGPGCRETEEFLADLIATSLPDLCYVIVNEAGAREYANSTVGREEFPNFDGGLRATISIGRRLQDPISEFVKIDPQNIGVGLYQHDVRRRDVKETLEANVSSCVNLVGVDVNTAHVSQLRYVAGLNALVGREIVEYRKQHGPFKNRQQLLQLPGMGQARFTQAAAFLKVRGGDNPLDRTWVHPESYELTGKFLNELGFTPNVIDDAAAQPELRSKFNAVNIEDMAGRLGVGAPTLQDIMDALVFHDQDPRDETQSPILKKGILKLEDLQPGMELKGTVLNVVDFGAFVDIGLKDSGLVHISQIANRYIKSPYDVVAVNDVVSVWVMTVDKERHRVSLTMIKPGSERKIEERRERPPQGDRPPRGEHPPRGRRPEGQGQPGGDRRPPPRGGRPGGPPSGRGPRREQVPAGSEQSSGSGTSAPAETGSRSAPPPRPPLPPRRPRREAPRPKLSQDALEGKVPLRTFGELSALFAAKTTPPPPPPAPPPPPQASTETPPAVSAETPSPAPEIPSPQLPAPPESAP